MIVKVAKSYWQWERVKRRIEAYRRGVTVCCVRLARFGAYRGFRRELVIRESSQITKKPCSVLIALEQDFFRLLHLVDLEQRHALKRICILNMLLSNDVQLDQTGYFGRIRFR